MNNYTNADFEAALSGWLKLHEGMRSHSHDCAPQSIHTANDDLRDSSAAYHTASTPVPTTLMGTFSQTNYTYPASEQRLDRQHSLTLPHHSVSRRLGPCWAHVGPILAAHPRKIYFCDDCGDFFARSDSLKRYRVHPPAECLDISPEKANEKRRMTQDTHDEFTARLEGCLGTGEDIGIPFSQIVKDMYPNSSKKRKKGAGGR